MRLLDGTNMDALVTFENHGIFNEIDNRYNFGVVTFENTGSTEELRGKFMQRDLAILNNLEEEAVTIPQRVLTDYSPEARVFPQIEHQIEVDVLDKILRHPSLADELDTGWEAKPFTKELHEPTDKHRFVESAEEGEYPVYSGSNFYQYHHNASLLTGLESPQLWSFEEETDPERSAKRRIREKRFNKGEPKKAVYEQFGGPETGKSQKQFVNDLLTEHRDEPLTEEDVLLDCTEYRIAYRDIANSTNERTMIATVLPKGTVAVHTVQTLRPYEIAPEADDLTENPLHGVYERVFSDEELFVALGLLNSLPFDFLMRTKVDTHVVKYKLEESQMPRLTAGDEWFEYIWRRAARLNCYGDAFAEMRERLGGIEPATDEEERRQLQTEIDAAAFHAYGLDREETKFVLEDFHRVRNPRMMTEDYFRRVLEEYDTLAESGRPT